MIGPRAISSTLRFVVTVLLLMSIIALAVPAASAFGYRDIGYDPDDIPRDPTSCCQQDPDIRSTTRKVRAAGDGRAWLSITVRIFEEFLGYWDMRVQLDSRGGSRVDYKMKIWDTGTGEAGCTVRRRGRSRATSGLLRLTTFTDEVTCVVPFRIVRANKRIRWRVHSIPGREGSGPRIHEHAPRRHGWYE